jgi:hypothetical protein
VAGRFSVVYGSRSLLLVIRAAFLPVSFRYVNIIHPFWWKETPLRSLQLSRAFGSFSDFSWINGGKETPGMAQKIFALIRAKCRSQAFDRGTTKGLVCGFAVSPFSDTQMWLCCTTAEC